MDYPRIGETVVVKYNGRQFLAELMVDDWAIHVEDHVVMEMNVESWQTLEEYFYDQQEYVDQLVCMYCVEADRLRRTLEVVSKNCDELFDTVCKLVSALEDTAPCGHPERFTKVEVNDDAWCLLCYIEKQEAELIRLRVLTSEQE